MGKLLVAYEDDRSDLGSQLEKVEIRSAVVTFEVPFERLTRRVLDDVFGVTFKLNTVLGEQVGHLLLGSET